MLIGQYTVALDDKKRLSIPTPFRGLLGKRMILTRGLDSCLFVYSKKSWGSIVSKMGTLSLGANEGRGFNRFLLAGATEAEMDSAGRVLVPDFLKQFAGLSKNVVVAGVGDRAELWDEKRWNEYSTRIAGEADAMAEKLSAVGAI